MSSSPTVQEGQKTPCNAPSLVNLTSIRGLAQAHQTRLYSCSMPDAAAAIHMRNLAGLLHTGRSRDWLIVVIWL